MAGDIEDKARAMHRFEQPLPRACQTDIGVESAAAERVGNIIRYTADAEPNFAIGTQVAEGRFTIDEQPARRLPARYMGDPSLVMDAADVSHAACRSYRCLVRIEKSEEARKTCETVANALVPTADTAGF